MTQRAVNNAYLGIDHIAIAVVELEPAVRFYTEVLGFSLIQRREIKGARTGMLSAELEHGGLKFVLCQGTEADSQVSRLVSNCGPGVAHIALAVEDLAAVASDLRARGLAFDTDIIAGPGLQQLFSARDKNSGLSFEFIERNGAEGFAEENVQELFNQLERSGAY